MFLINGEYWAILSVPSTHFKLKRSDGSYTIGVCDDNDKIIYLSNQLHGHFLKKVLCHEITHAAMFSYNIYLTTMQEEIVADIMATYGNEIINITEQMFGK
jgi:hypothetical protein